MFSRLLGPLSTPLQHQAASYIRGFGSTNKTVPFVIGLFQHTARRVTRTAPHLFPNRSMVIAQRRNKPRIGWPKYHNAWNSQRRSHVNRPGITSDNHRASFEDPHSSPKSPTSTVLRMGISGGNIPAISPTINRSVFPPNIIGARAAHGTMQR